MAAFHRPKKPVPIEPVKQQPPAAQVEPVEADAEKKARSPRKKKGA